MVSYRSGVGNAERRVEGRVATMEDGCVLKDDTPVTMEIMATRTAVRALRPLHLRLDTMIDLFVLLPCNTILQKFS